MNKKQLTTLIESIVMKQLNEANIFNEDNIKDVVAQIEKELKQFIPVLSVKTSPIGHDSIIVKMSFEPKSDWENGIYQNSNHAMFMLEQNGLLENFQSSIWNINGKRLKMKARKATVKSTKDAIIKIKKYIDKVKEAIK